MPVIELQQVYKRLGGVSAVQDLSLTVRDGTLCGFIGPNGSGKTTTLRLIMRIYAPDSGRVCVLGDDSHGPANDRVGYLPEERMLYKSMRVDEVLTYLARLKGYRPTPRQIDQWLEKLELGGVSRRRVQTLSKGQVQRVQLIAVLIARPKLVLLDEPFSGLDPINAVVVRDTILDLHRQGTTVVFSTHDMSLAEKMCDSIVMIFRGRKVLDGSLQQIRSAYGRDTIRVRLSGQTRVPSLSGVEGMTDFGQYQELHLQPGTDPQLILERLMSIGRVERFELSHPSLEDIFVRIAGANRPIMSEGA
jgi:ABC-2 type transport system ATP-binding protein